MKVIIMRGLPGSGKSTWIQKNLSHLKPPTELWICSADHHLYQDGEYVWTPERLHMAHSRCQNEFLIAMQSKTPPQVVVVDNCNLTNRDMRFYVEAAEKAGAEIEIRTIHTPPEVAMGRQLHGVPQEKYALLVQRLTMPIRPDWQKYEVTS